ncbi:MAG: protein-L-isoaspartate(D-aspartate) O-methyltransferase [Acidimicrobiia bacterium]|nr:protein-L-isoaspartate(D-aspartate) O-methyltransferase [Acidimicrobiia bacterium]
MAVIDEKRRRMVAQVAARGVSDERVLAALGSVRRERFVAAHLADRAYDDGPLDIGLGQTISQPYIVAVMAEAAGIEPGDQVLEVGTGSGYGAAVLAALGAEVWTIERLAPLADEARRHLEAEGVAVNGPGGVHVIVGDGSVGFHPEGAGLAPWDAIVVTAAAPEVPRALVAQLADGGTLVLPVGKPGGVQALVRIRRQGERFEPEDLGPVRFVPLVSD